jgi:hypothetical protein
MRCYANSVVCQLPATDPEGWTLAYSAPLAGGSNPAAGRRSERAHEKLLGPGTEEFAGNEPCRD